jgi:hypothetical protein
VEVRPEGRGKGKRAPVAGSVRRAAGPTRPLLGLHVEALVGFPDAHAALARSVPAGCPVVVGSE